MRAARLGPGAPQVSEEAYIRVVDAENVNRREDVVEASGVEGALSALATVGISSPAEPDKHPEK